MKVTSLHILPALALAALVMPGCDETNSNIGASLAGNSVEIMVDSSFTLTGRSVPIKAIRPNTSEQMIGCIHVPNFGTLQSDVVTQFLPSTKLDTETFSAENIDSLFLTLRYSRNAYIGDSIAPMGLTVYRLIKPIDSSLNSAFDPEGYYDPKPLGSVIYNASVLNKPGVAALTYSDIDVKLPVEFGRELFNAYKEDPANYANGQIFSQKVLNGLYFKNTYGNGRMTLVSVCGITMHLRKIYTPEGETKPDTVDLEPLYYLVTPEVVTNNNLTYTMSDRLAGMYNDGHTLMVAPLGSEIEFTFPAPEIISAYRRADSKYAVVNSLSMTIPVDSIPSGSPIDPPPYALMVLKKDREEFFAKNKLPDGLTSFYSTYDADRGCYSFGSLRNYIISLLDKEEVTPEDYTFSLVPVQVNFEETVSNSYYGSTSTTESEVLPYLIAPVMGDVRLKDAKIKFSYTLQSQK